MYGVSFKIERTIKTLVLVIIANISFIEGNVLEEKYKMSSRYNYWISHHWSLLQMFFKKTWQPMSSEHNYEIGVSNKLISEKTIKPN